jgi:hypothetical protein
MNTLFCLHWIFLARFCMLCLVSFLDSELLVNTFTRYAPKDKSQMLGGSNVFKARGVTRCH